MASYPALIDEQADIDEGIGQALESLKEADVTSASRTVLENHKYFKDKYHRACEEVYLLALEKMQEMKEQMDAARAGETDAHNQSIASVALPVSSLSGLKLPKGEIPFFDADPAQWINFRDNFFNLMTMNPQLSSVYRLHLLKNHLGGDVERRIRNIDLDGKNYQLVWDSLMEYYDNKRSLMNVSLSMIFNAPMVMKDSIESLERLYTDVTQALTLLETLERSVSQWDDRLVYIVVKKLNRASIAEWERTLGGSLEPQTWKELRAFMLSRIRVLQSYQADYAGVPVTNSSYNGSAKSSLNFSRGSNGAGGAKVHQRKSFSHRVLTLSGSVNQRIKRLNRLKLCFNCLGHHIKGNCPSTTHCQKCSGRHHTSIHFKKSKSAAADVGGPPQGVPPGLSAHAQTFIPGGGAAEDTGAATHAVTHKVSAGASSAILATAMVKVKSLARELVEGRALIDPYSQVTLTTKKFAQQLRVPRRHYSQMVLGVGGASSSAAKGIVIVELFSGWGHRVCEAEAIILTPLTDYIPRAVPYRQWSVLEGLQLADPEFSSTRGIDMILGVGVYSQIIQLGLRRETLDQPVAQQTSLGWILPGRCRLRMLRGGRQQEEFAEVKTEVDSGDTQCEDYYKATCSRNDTGRYVVRMPFKASPQQLGNSRGLALRMLNRLKARLSRDPELHQKYRGFLKEYEELEHMFQVKPQKEGSAIVYYLPYHLVGRESSLTTKLRVVFNGSAKATSRLSLNNLLHEGPKLQARILWLDDSGEVVEYQLNTVMYGTRSASYLAIRMLQQLAKDRGVEFPKAREVILKTTYMDDVYGRSSTEDSCRRELMEINQDQKEIEVLTERIVLSQVAQLYDPLGWIAPFFVKRKLLVQELGSLKLRWDNELAEETVQHASGVAYGAVIYLKIVGVNGDVNISLVSAKSKLAPVQEKKGSAKVTIPRLELMGAYSSVALTWIKSDPARYKQFVKNRVSEIQRLMPQANWRHVPGKDNPADLVSRGVSKQRFAVNDSESLERKNLDVHAACVGAGSEYQSWDFVGRYSSLRELLPVTAWCRRVFLVRRENTSNGARGFKGLFLQPSEIEEARVFWIREIHAEYFYEDIKKLREMNEVALRSVLFRLVPFLDGEGIICLTGRFQKSSLEEDFKHPVILPSSSKFTELVLMEAHRQTFHGGVQVMQALLRRKDWVLGGRRSVKSFMFRCVICTRHHGAMAKPTDGSVAFESDSILRFSSPWSGLSRAVDFAELEASRSQDLQGVFMVIFVCFMTSAVHIELVTDYSIEGFLACYRRFSARRDICETITSHRGTNLVGADGELRRLFDATGRAAREIAHNVSKDGTKWNFNPPAALHHRGK
ncbi:uncharacterized protein LOC107044101 [Diachasma alloeum]|uniref:uncharacterized protein LOC107044101 n=1 Tax=Diachasma alloeum TaxID=454923 RepID=UPI0007381E01|nr:uncharacterized protein LOC107044101 [Diachasma alloeum]